MKRRSVRLAAANVASPPTPEVPDRRLRNRQPSSLGEESNNISENGDDDIKESGSGPNSSYSPRSRKGRKENMWNNSMKVSTPLACKNVTLAAACDMVPVSPKMSSLADPVLSLTPRKTTLERTLHEKNLALTPVAKGKRAARRKDTFNDSLMELGGTPEKLTEKTETVAETTQSQFSCSVDMSGNSPKLKLKRMNSELELATHSPLSAKIASSTKGTPLDVTPTKSSRNLRSTAVKRTSRRLDLSQSNSSPLNETDEKCVTARRSARLQSTPNAFYGDKIVSASSEDDSDFDNESQSPSDSDSSDGCLSGDDNTPGVNTPLRRTYNISAAALETPKVKKVVAEISADCTPRRTPNIDNLKNTPMSESYFTAEKRIKFGTPLSVQKAEEKMKAQEKRSGLKKPRKGNRQGINKQARKIPLLAPEFSVSKEFKKIPLDAERENPWYLQHEEAIIKIQNEIESEFPRWILYLREGFNIMLHGYGSKKGIFDAFSKYVEDDFPVVVINGLFTKFNAKKFVSDFALSIDDDLHLKSTSVNIMTEDLLTRTSAKSPDHYFIFVLNFDALAARHPQMLTALAGLAQLPFVHIVASSDHVNAGLGVSPNDNALLNFFWIDCTTFVEYSDEIVWLGDIFGNAGDGAGGKNSLEHIFKSLTANAKKAFGLLAGLQLRAKKGKRNAKNFNGIEFRELLRTCRESFVAHSELVLKSLLTEFIDHKLIHYSGKGKHDDNFLMIDLDDEILEKYAEN